MLPNPFVSCHDLSRVVETGAVVVGVLGIRFFTSIRIASQTIAAFRWPRWREVHEKFTRLFQLVLTPTYDGLFPVRKSARFVLSRCKTHRNRGEGLSPMEQQKHKNTIRPPTNDRTCMGWHTRHASILSRLEQHLRCETLNLTQVPLTRAR
jgi:hypothetical protein